MKIRQLSGGKKSLDDFAALFFSRTPAGHGNTGPEVFPYTFADVVTTLNETQPFDWATFWTTRLNALTTSPQAEGFEEAGYSYITAEDMTPNEASFIKPSPLGRHAIIAGILCRQR